jgi:endogenous inhibitor of DNA gyrase (YacG/DUF329 family)
MTDIEKEEILDKTIVYGLATAQEISYFDAAMAAGIKKDAAIDVVNGLLRQGKLVAAKRHGRWVAETGEPIMERQDATKCVICAKFFAQTSKTPKTYCSDKCKQVAYAGRRKADERLAPCAFCGTEFISRPQKKGNYSRFCSPSCSGRKRV